MEDPAALIDVLRTVTNIGRIKIMLLMSDISGLIAQAGLLNIKALALFYLPAEEVERGLVQTIGGPEKLGRGTVTLKAVARNSMEFLTVLWIDKLEFTNCVTICVLSKPDRSSIPLASIVANCREKIPSATAADVFGRGLNRCRDHR